LFFPSIKKAKRDRRLFFLEKTLKPLYCCFVRVEGNGKLCWCFGSAYASIRLCEFVPAGRAFVNRGVFICRQGFAGLLAIGASGGERSAQAGDKGADGIRPLFSHEPDGLGADHGDVRLAPQKIDVFLAADAEADRERQFGGRPAALEIVHDAIGR